MVTRVFLVVAVATVVEAFAPTCTTGRGTGLVGLAAQRSCPTPHELNHLTRRDFAQSVASHSVLLVGGSTLWPHLEVARAGELPSEQRGIHADHVGKSFREVARVTSGNVVKPPTEDQVLVKVKYAGINGGCETFRARGEGYYTFNKNKGDIGFGAEGTGVVVSAGPSAQLRPGTPVAFLSDGQAFSEYVTIPSSYCIAVDKADAANCALRISGVTANNAINIKLQAQKGETILITGAAGGTGNLAVQLAKLNGCKVIACCGTEAKAALLKGQGVDHVINYRAVDLGDALERVAPGGLDCCLEGVGGRTLQTAMARLKPAGRLCILGYISQYAHNGDNADATAFDFDGMGLDEFFWKGKSMLRGDQRIFGNVFVNYALSFESRVDTFQAYAEGKLKPVLDAKEFVGLESVADAVDHMLSGKSIGKVVVRIA